MPCEPVAELASRMFALRDAVHAAHWATRSHAEHEALGGLYEGIPGAVDALVEAWQGQFGLVGEVPRAAPVAAAPGGAIAAAVVSHAEWIASCREAVAKGSPGLLALVDELLALLLKSSYKLLSLS